MVLGCVFVCFSCVCGVWALGLGVFWSLLLWGCVVLCVWVGVDVFFIVSLGCVWWCGVFWRGAFVFVFWDALFLFWVVSGGCLMGWLWIFFDLSVLALGCGVFVCCLWSLFSGGRYLVLFVSLYLF